MMSREARKRIEITGIVVGLATLAIFFANCHIVHGGGAGWHLCKKWGWSFEDVFVDLDDYGGGRSPPPKVGEAIDRCLK